MKQKLIALFVTFLILSTQVSVFANIAQCGAKIVQGDEIYTVDATKPSSYQNAHISSEDITLNGGAVYEFTLPIYSDRVVIKNESVGASINFIIDDFSETITLLDKETIYTFKTPLRIGEKTLEIRGNAKISSIDFLQITEQTAEATLELFNRTDFEEASKTAVIMREGSPVIKINGATRYFDYDDLSITPLRKDGSLYINAKAFADALSWYFEEDKEKGFAVIRKEQKELVYLNGAFIAYENDAPRTDVEVIPYEYNGTMYLPLRKVCEFFDEYVLYKDGFVIIDFRSRAKALSEEWFSTIKEEYEDFMPTGTAGKTYYVSQDRNASDSNTGTIDAPFRTIKRASEVAKAGDTVIIREGRWSEMIKPVNDGTPTAPITYKAMEGEEVMLYACDEISGFKEYKDGILVASVPWDLGLGRNQVFYEDKNLVEARYPNVEVGEDGLFEFRNGLRLNPIWVTPGDIKVNPSNTMVATSETLLQEEEENYWKDAVYVAAQGHGWTLQTAIIESSKKGEITFGNVSDTYWSDARISNPNYGYITCHVNAIDLPGEWTMKNNLLYIMPPEGETAESLKLMVKSRQLLIDLYDSKYIHIKGFKGFGGGVRMNEAEMCVISGCDLQYSSHYTFTEDQRSLYMDRNWFDPNGAPPRGEMGIYLGGENNAVINNRISFAAGTAVFVVGSYGYIDNNVMTDICYGGNSCGAIHIDIEMFKPLAIKRGGHTITRNTIKNIARTAIDVQSYAEGAVYAPQSFLPCEIAYNDISDSSVCTMDTGMIYFWGSNMGDDFTTTKIHNNYVYSTAPYADKILGAIYMDNRMTGVDSYDNLIFSNMEGQFTNDIYEQQVSQFPTSYATVDSWNNVNVGVKFNAKADLILEDFPGGKPFKVGSSLLSDNYSMTYDSYTKDDFAVYYAKDAQISQNTVLENGKAKLSNSGSWIKFENIDFDKGSEVKITYTGDYYKGDDNVEVIIGDTLESENKLSVTLIPDSKSLTALNCATVSTTDLNLTGKHTVWIKAVEATNSAIHSIRVAKKYVTVFDFTDFKHDYKKIYGGTFTEYYESPTGESKPNAVSNVSVDRKYPLLKDTWGGGWVKYPNVEIKEDINTFKVCAGTNGKWAGTIFNLRVGSPDGAILASLEVGPTGWVLVEKSVALKKTLQPGTYDIYITFDGEGKSADVYWFGLE